MADQAARQPDGAPTVRTFLQGQDWSISEYVCAAGPDDRPFEEQHEQVTIAAVLDGTFNYWTERGKALLHPGALLLGNAGACFECGHDHGVGDRCIALQVSPAYFAEVAASRSGSSRFRFPAVAIPALPRLLPWLAWLEAQGARTEPLETDEAVPRILRAVIDGLSASRSTPGTPSAREERRVSQVLRYIEAHASEPLSLGELADVAIMSKYHFLRSFQRVVGMTPYQYFLSVRLRRVAVRLATSGEFVSTIAYETGFGDLSTFNGRFRDVFGTSPTAYRDVNRNGPRRERAHGTR